MTKDLCIDEGCEHHGTEHVCVIKKPKRKRLRAPKTKPGQLRMYWGREDRWSGPDIVIAYGGSGATKQDSALLYHYMGSEKMARDWSQQGGPIRWDPSLLKELESRGYDLTTLKFSIERKKDGNTN